MLSAFKIGIITFIKQNWGWQRPENRTQGIPSYIFFQLPVTASFVLQEMFYYHFIFKAIQLLIYNWLPFKIFIALSSSYTITVLSCPPWDLHSPAVLAECFRLWPLQLLTFSPKTRSFSALPQRSVFWLKYFFPLRNPQTKFRFSWRITHHSTPFFCPRWASSPKSFFGPTGERSRKSQSLEGFCSFQNPSFPSQGCSFLSKDCPKISSFGPSCVLP